MSKFRSRGPFTKQVTCKKNPTSAIGVGFFVRAFMTEVSRPSWVYLPASVLVAALAEGQDVPGPEAAYVPVADALRVHFVAAARPDDCLVVQRSDDRYQPAVASVWAPVDSVRDDSAPDGYWVARKADDPSSQEAQPVSEQVGWLADASAPDARVLDDCSQGVASVVAYRSVVELPDDLL
jgi:hypothetical protein